MLPVRSEAALPVLPEGVGNLLDAVAGHLSPRTRMEYLRDLRAFLRWYAPDAGDMAALRALLSLPPMQAHKVVADYRAHLRAQKRKPASINRSLSAIRAIWAALWAAGAVSYRLSIKGEPTRTDPRTRIAQRLPAQSLPELQSLLQKAATPR
ncbi:MAG: site-specific integrase, partial [Bacteroidia bacterium]